MAAPQDPATIVALGILGAALFVGLALLFYFSIQRKPNTNRKQNRHHKLTVEEEKRAAEDRIRKEVARKQKNKEKKATEKLFNLQKLKLKKAEAEDILKREEQEKIRDEEVKKKREREKS